MTIFVCITSDSRIGHHFGIGRRKPMDLSVEIISVNTGKGSYWLMRPESRLQITHISVNNAVYGAADFLFCNFLKELQLLGTKSLLFGFGFGFGFGIVS